MKILITENQYKIINDDINAWHGSPHYFEKFDIDKMGTGEGAQAFGWGIYCTDLKDIANMYSKSTFKFSRLIYLIGIYLYGWDFTPEKREYLMKQEKSDLINLIKEKHTNNIDKTNEDKKFEQLIKNISELKTNVYNVTIHKGKTPEQYDFIEWDKPLTPNQINKIINGFKKINYNGRIKYKNGILIKVWGGEDEIKTGKEFYRALAGDEGFNPKDTSLFLLNNGIDGIKYPTGSLSGIKDSDNYNYVVFDPNAISINKKHIQEQSHNINNSYTLYHGTNNNDLNINNIKNMWMSEDENYSKIWGENIYEININLNNILDTTHDIGTKKLTIKQMLKYLKNKNVDIKDAYDNLYDYLDSNEKYTIWEWIGNHKTIPYGWIALDIFHSGFDAIKLIEYGYSYKDKDNVLLVNNPKDKITSIKKIQEVE